MKYFRVSLVLMAVLPVVVGSLSACSVFARRAMDERLSPGDQVALLDTDFVQPIAGLSADNMARFDKGRKLFEKIFSPQDGLGPLFNATSCKACHGLPGAGGGSTLTATVTAGEQGGQGGANIPLKHKGGPMIQEFAIEGIPLERFSAETKFISKRLSPPTFGLGLIEAVPVTAITAQLAADKRKQALGIQGLANWEFDQIGRFGWKAQKGDMIEFTQQASQFEMGLSSPGRPQEHFPNLPPQALKGPSALNDPKHPFVKAFFDRKVADGKPMSQPDLTQEELEALTAFQRYQAPPPALPRDAVAERGRQLFGDTGCAVCHRPSFTTGPNDIGVPEGLDVPLYSDILIHDLGQDSSDGIVMGVAQGHHWRTTPLWGLRFRTRLMHDGRADSFGEAIAQHGGEGTIVANRYAKLSLEDKAAIAAFLKTL